MVRSEIGQQYHNVQLPSLNQPIAGVGTPFKALLKGGLECGNTRRRHEYAKEVIRVKHIAPGVIKTRMHKPETLTFSKPSTRSVDRRFTKSRQLCVLTDATLLRAKYYTWMAAHPPAKW